MSWLGRVFGRREAPASASTVVVIPDELAAELTTGGLGLGEAVLAALRDHLEAQRRVSERSGDGRVPFWLARDGVRDDIESELRDRIAQRRAEEEAAAAAGPRRRGRAVRGDAEPGDA